MNNKLNSWKRAYYAMTSNLDYNVGRLFDFIRQEGLEEDTIFVFTSDHGELFGAHGRHAKNIFYEEAIRVPFLIHWGNKLPKIRNATPINTVDIMPTLLSIMGLPVPESTQGTDISNHIIEGSFKENDCLLMGTGPTAIYHDGTEWRGLRTERFTYAVYKLGKKEFLFDNINDPYQLKNLADKPEYSDILKELKRKMHGKMADIGDKFRWNTYYMRHWVKNRKIQITSGFDRP